MRTPERKTALTDSPRLIGRHEAAAYCGISPTCFSMWVATHKMPPAIPGTRKWDKRAIDAKLDEISGLTPADQEDEFEKWERKHTSRKASSDLADWRERKRKRDKHKPLMKLDAKLERILLFMGDRPDCDTLVTIPGAGPTYIEHLVKVGAVRRSGGEGADFQYRVTEEGTAEAKRIKKWRALAP